MRAPFTAELGVSHHDAVLFALEVPFVVVETANVTTTAALGFLLLIVLVSDQGLDLIIPFHDLRWRAPNVAEHVVGEPRL